MEGLLHRKRVGFMLGLLYASMQALGGIFLADRYGLLHNDRSGVDTLVHQVNSTASELHPVIKGLLYCQM